MNEPLSERAQRCIGAILAGRYRPTEVLSESSSGVLLSADDTREGRRVSIQIIYPEAAGAPEANAELENEVAVASRIFHPAIAAARRAGIAEDGSTILLLPDISAPSIRAVIDAEGGRVPLARAAIITKHIAIALDALHSVGVVHRALTPDCVHVLKAEGSDREEVRIAGFGFAQLDPTSPRRPLDPASPAHLYSAPEVRAGKAVDGRADFYSLGLLFYEMATGAGPALERRESIPTMTSIRSVPTAVDKLALRLLADDPSRRAAIAMDIAAALEALVDPPPPPPPKGAAAPSSASGGAASPRAIASRAAGTSGGPAGGKGRADISTMPAPAVTAQIMPSSKSKEPGPPSLLRALVDAPREVHIYIAGVMGILLLLALAVTLRAPADGDDIQPEAQPASAPAPALRN